MTDYGINLDADGKGQALVASLTHHEHEQQQQQPLKAWEYSVVIPNCNGSIPFAVQPTPKGEVAFKKYVSLYNGQNLAQQCHMIRSAGDVIVQIDGVSMAGKTFEQTLKALLESAQRSASWLVFRESNHYMFRRTELEELLLKQTQQKEEHQQRIAYHQERIAEQDILLKEALQHYSSTATALEQLKQEELQRQIDTVAKLQAELVVEPTEDPRKAIKPTPCSSTSSVSSYESRKARAASTSLSCLRQPPTPLKYYAVTLTETHTYSEEEEEEESTLRSDDLERRDPLEEDDDENARAPTRSESQIRNSRASDSSEYASLGKAKTPRTLWYRNTTDNSLVLDLVDSTRDVHDTKNYAEVAHSSASKLPEETCDKWGTQHRRLASSSSRTKQNCGRRRQGRDDYSVVSSSQRAKSDIHQAWLEEFSPPTPQEMNRRVIRNIPRYWSTTTERWILDRYPPTAPNTPPTLNQKRKRPPALNQKRKRSSDHR